LGNPLGRFQNFRQVASYAESIEAMAVGNNGIKQCVCMILELAPYMSKRCCMPGERGAERIALIILERVSSVHLRCTLGHNDAVRTVPRYPLEKVSSCDIIDNRVFPTRTLARRDCNVSSRCVFCLMSCSACM